MHLSPKTELVPIYNRYYDLDEDEFNEEGQRIVIYEEVLVGYDLIILRLLLGASI